MATRTRLTSLPRTGGSLIATCLLAVSGFVALGVFAAPASAALLSTPAPVAEPGPTVATTDALPTVQINGVVWSQAIVANTVYAGGNFGKARPAGSPAGKNEVTRTHLLAYDLSTGVLNPTFAPTLNGQVKTVVASPDGSRIYVGGQFTTINGSNRYRIAAFSTATGALIAGFAPPVNYTVDSIAATNTTVYAGGAFSTVGSVARSRLAAFSATNGALLAWNPSADATVLAIVLAAGDTKIVAGGAFANLNATSVFGLGALDAASGAVLPFPANVRVHNYGSAAAINSLSTDGTAIYGTGYAFYAAGGTGTLEGVFSADPNTGALNWVEDCHGDSYGAHSANGVVYAATHSHFCTNVGGFPDTNPRVGHRALAFSAQAVGTLKHNTAGTTYTDWGGTPAPAMYNWFPDLDPGLFTGQSQAAWDVTGNGEYVIMGGEFLKANGVNQQGIVRYALRPTAPGVDGPRVAVVPTLAALSNNSVRVSWQTSWDRDNENLTYRVIRAGNDAAPVAAPTITSQFWNRPSTSFTDTGLTSGTTYNYRVNVVDPFGNVLVGSDISVTTPGVAGNQPPVAAFTPSCTDLTCSFDGAASFDPDGSVNGYSWDFGDGASATGNPAGHTYGAAGTYPVTLTVTDIPGATNSTTQSVTVPVVISPLVGADAFNRTVGNAWASADIGGAWTVGGVPVSDFSVAPGAGRMRMSTGGLRPSAYLNEVSVADSDSAIDVTFDKAPSGSDFQYAYLAARHAGASMYELRTKVLGSGAIQLSALRVLSGTETTLATQTISGLSFTPGQYLRMRLRVTGTAPVSLAGKLWPAGSAEPSTWQLSFSDVTNALGAGGPGLLTYLVAGAANAPVETSFANLAVGPPAGP